MTWKLISGANSPVAQKTDILSIARTLGHVAAIWLDPADPFRQEAIIALQVSTGYASSMIEDALKSAFEELTEPKLLDFIAKEPGFQNPSELGRVLHILAGNVFTAWLPGAVTIVPWEEGLLSRYPAVVTYGSDETLAAVRAQIPAGVRLVEYGHKFSVALILKEVLTVEELPGVVERLEKDAAPFDLQGCLSPQIVYVEGEDPGIFEKLFARVNAMPAIKRFDTWEELKGELQLFQRHLSALGYAGPDERIDRVRPELQGMGLSRICVLGEMQRPSLSWRNGGISLVDALTSR